MTDGSAEKSLEASWGEREVRRLLNALRRPDIAQADPLGRLLCDVLGVATPLEAMSKLINATFAGQGRAGARLAQLLIQCDIEGTLSQSGVAAEMGLSLRQFFRYRARAIRLLSERIRILIGEPGQAPDALRTLAELVGETSPSTAMAIYELTEGRHDEEHLIRRMSSHVEAGGEVGDVWISECPEPWKTLATAIQARAFELNGDTGRAQECIERVRARLHDDHPLRARIQTELLKVDVLRAKHAHDPAALYRTGRALRGVESPSREHLTRALLVEAEASLRLGHAADASEMLRYIHRISRNTRDVRSMALATLLSANHALLCGDLAAADELATGAFFALKEQRADAAFCQMTVARARLPLGKRWTMPADNALRPQYAWDRLGLEIIDARYFLRDAKFDSACELAENVYDAARNQGYRGLAAHAAATIAACNGLRGDDAVEQRSYVHAWSLIAATGDRLAACDVFTMPVVRPKDLGPLRIDEEFSEAIARRARALAPRANVSPNACAQAIAFASGNSSLREYADRLVYECGDDAYATLGDDLALTLPFERRNRWLQRWNEVRRKKDACEGSQASSHADFLSA